MLDEGGVVGEAAIPPGGRRVDLLVSFDNPLLFDFIIKKGSGGAAGMAKVFIRNEHGCAAQGQGDAAAFQPVGGIFGFTGEMAKLDRAWSDPQMALCLLDGPIGSGKTALLHKWLYRMQQQAWLDAEAVYVWTFFPPDLAHAAKDPVEEFFQHALYWFGGKDAAQTPNLLQGELLARLVQAHHTLLVLDGVDVVQSRTGSAAGRLVDPRLNQLLARLQLYNPGLCVVAGRQAVMLDAEFPGQVQRLTLGKLDVEDCISLLRHHGVEAEPIRLQEIALDYGQNPQTLALLASYLATWHGGDWRRLDHVPVLMDAQPDGRQARRVLVANSAELAGKPAESLLYLLSLLYRPTHWSTLSALFGKRPFLSPLFMRKPRDSFAQLVGRFAGLSKRRQREAIALLQRLGLLEVAGQCYWLPEWVREAWQRQLRYDWPQAWKEANQRLMLFHAALPQVEALPEVTPLVASNLPSVKGVAAPLPTILPQPVVVQSPPPVLALPVDTVIGDDVELVVTPPVAQELGTQPALVAANGAAGSVELQPVAPAFVAEAEGQEAVPAAVEGSVPVADPLSEAAAMMAGPMAAATGVAVPDVSPASLGDNIVPFLLGNSQPVVVDAASLDAAAAALRRYVNAMQILQVRTRKLQKQLRDFDHAVQVAKPRKQVGAA